MSDTEHLESIYGVLPLETLLAEENRLQIRVEELTERHEVLVRIIGERSIHAS